MDRATINTLHRRLLARLQTDTTDCAATPGTVAASSFTCPDLLARERQSLFARTPQPVALSGEIADPGDYLTLQVLGTPVLLTRDEGGAVHAFINACAHRGSPVALGSGSARSLICPFHGWAYRLDGRLRGRPQADCFSSSEPHSELRSLPVSENYGIVVIGLTQDMPQSHIDNALLEIGEELRSMDLASYRPLARRAFSVRANWKLVNDLSLESYHFHSLHRDSVAQILEANAVVDTFGRHSRWAFPFKSIAALEDRDEAEWPDQLQGSCTYTLYPGVMLVVNSLGAQFIRAEPGPGPAQSNVDFVGMCSDMERAKEATQAFEFGEKVFAQEDLPAAEACQQGLSARGGELPLGRNEPLLQFWHRLWREACEEREERS
ncbi:MAG: aromatic ring-hydroxylating dioxygenase subunit alpha [Pseudomonadota bacterium]